MSNHGDNNNSGSGSDQDGLPVRRNGGKTRFPEPQQLQGATAFSQSGETRNPIWLVETVEQTEVVRQVLRAAEVETNWGRRRNEGHWPLALLGFVDSDSIDLKPWYDATPESFWLACGFDHKPGYKTAYGRMTELEDYEAVFETAAGELIKLARSHQPLIGMYLHVDSTEAETHAALVHDCQPGEGCPWQAEAERRRGRRMLSDRLREQAERDAEYADEQADSLLDTYDAIASGDHPDASDETTNTDEGQPRTRKPATRPGRVPTAVARSDRQRKGGVAPVDEDRPDYGDATEVVEEDDRRRIRVGQHWYRTLDKTAGVRAYTGKRGAIRFWHGFYNVKMSDHLMHAPVAIRDYTASRQEHLCYADTLDHALANLGVAPRAVVGDRGFSLGCVFETNSRHGIASVFPWRQNQPNESRNDLPEVDRHGVPRCKYCGAPTEFVRFNHEPYPRLWVRCRTGKTDACREVQTVACSTNWRLLLPLWRDDPVYMELRRSHGTFESVHDYWRDRYKVGPANIGQRPKRKGIEWQQLRASAALLIEWLRICHREGWLDGERRNPNRPRRVMNGDEAATNLREFRHQVGLAAPYGPVAAHVWHDRRLRRTPSNRWQVICRWEKRRKQREKETAARGTAVADA